jgi:predicted secreted protein
VRRLFGDPHRAATVRGATVGHPTRYDSTETYLATREGDRTVQRTGRWTILRGSATDRDATVYQLDFDRADVRRNFLRVGDAELRLLDRDEREITSTAPLSLHRVPNEQSVEPITIAERDSGRVVDVARGQTVVIRLSSNRSTGHRWTLAPGSAGVLAALGEPVYTPASAPSGAVGKRGVEAWSFLASQRGRQELRFEYRRPWEPDAAATVLHYTIAVR